MLVRIRGEDVTLGRDCGVVGSARNRLAAPVVSVQPGIPLLCVELESRSGVTVTAVIKAPAFHLIRLA